MNPNPEELEQALGYTFRDRALLARALTHSSSANEHHSQAPDSGAVPDNERLEFLGDSVLGWLVSEWLFIRFPDFSEGRLSLVKNHLVSAAHLLDAAHELDLGRFLRLGRGEETAGGRSKQRLLANTVEAIIAAAYLDGGMETARRIIERHVIPPDAELVALSEAGPPQDFRAELDRLARDRALPRPQYRLVGESGPGHARNFVMEVCLGKEFTAKASGTSKKTASHSAARQVCEMIRGD